LTPLDVTSFGLAISMLGFASLLGAWFPARRASKLDPAVALRE
jgi:ABC-type antimicrobial peptide transport system permease subunit